MPKVESIRTATEGEACCRRSGQRWPRLASPRRFSKRFKPRSRLLLAHGLEGRDGRQLLGTGSGLSALPVVDGLPRRTHQEADVIGRQCEPLPMCCQALRTKSRGAQRNLLGFDRCNFGSGLAQPTHFLLERLSTPLERGDVCAIGSYGLFECCNFAADFFASDTGNLGFEDGSNVWHRCDCATFPF